MEFVGFFLEKYEFLYKLSLPEFGTAAFWILLIICIVIIIAIWLFTRTDYNNIVKILLMMLFSTIHVAAWCIIIAMIFMMLGSLLFAFVIMIFFVCLIIEVVKV